MLRFVRYNFFRETRRVPILTGLYKIQFPHHMKRLLVMGALWLGWEAHLVNPSQVIKSYVNLSIHTEQVLASLPKVWRGGKEGRMITHTGLWHIFSQDNTLTSSQSLNKSPSKFSSSLQPGRCGTIAIPSWVFYNPVSHSFQL